MFTVPNILTILRLAALPIAAYCWQRQQYVLAAVSFVVLMLTDCIDGWIARRFNQTSRLGLYLDPVVDKIVIVGMFYQFAVWGRLPMAIPHLFLTRELLQNGIRAAASSQGQVIGANWMGKVKATLQNVVITIGLALPALASPHLDAVWLIATWATVCLAWIFFAVFLYWNRRSLA